MPRISPEAWIAEHLELLYDVASGRPPPDEIADLIDAFQSAPGKRGLLEVESVHRIREDIECARRARTKWDLAALTLDNRLRTGDIPDPKWKQLPLDFDTLPQEEQTRLATELRDREEVYKDLMQGAERKPGLSKVRIAKIFFGSPSLDVLTKIFRNGWAMSKLRTKGWYGEGLYSTRSAPNAMRYTLGMRDIWDCPGETGFVIAGRVVFGNVFPVTQADNDKPLASAWKGTRLAEDCDAHYACVRGVPPNAHHANRTYHACEERQRPDADELVVNQEAHLLPEYLVKVRVVDDAQLCDHIRLAEEHWGRRPVEAASSGGPSMFEAVRRDNRAQVRRGHHLHQQRGE